MRFVSRSEWGARAPRSRTDLDPPMHGVTLHWAGPSPHISGHSECDNVVRSFQNYHMDSHGWADIGYNALSCPHGYVFEGRGLWVEGAHAGASDIGGNSYWYGVCYLGGVGDPLTDEGKQAFVDAVQWFREEGGAGDRVNGHRDHHSTQCPGDDIYAWIQEGLEVDDMPSAKEVVDELLSRDVFKLPWNSPDNPTWNFQNTVESIHANAYQANKQSAALAKGSGADIDESALAEQLIAALSPDKIAGAVVDRLGPELAGQVVTELSARLEK